LEEAGLSTPRLVETSSGSPYLEGPTGGVFRLLTYLEGATFDVVQSHEQARSAGRLVGRFHSALDGLEHTFVGLRSGVHDTDGHLRRLRSSLEVHEDHRLHAEVALLGRAVLDRAALLAPLPELDDRICHGDLKFNNVRFAGEEAPQRDRALALIDLDTLGPLHLGYELGDAWRSWCNRAGEDRTEADLDLSLFSASLEGYLEGLGRELGEKERRALLLGPEWVSLELSARFALDALEERYFGWDETRYDSAGEHNLVRARGQWSVHEAFVASRSARAVAL
jgi:Ser/Thr protein kinase RdoA (MazF antagonist)